MREQGWWRGERGNVKEKREDQISARVAVRSKERSSE